MSLLPEPGPEAYRVLRGERRWARAAEVIAARHGVAGPLELASVGFHVVVLGRERVIKLISPTHARDAVAERIGLTLAAGRLPVATPELLAEGELEGWPYLILRRLPGTSALERWPGLDASARARLVAEAGELAAALHALPVAGADALALDWPAYAAERREAMSAKHRRRGLDDAWVAAIEAFVDALPDPRTWPARPVFVHGDLHLDHLHLDPDTSRVCGLLDFADVQVGPAELEFVTVGGFLAPRLPGAASVFLRAYGLDARTPELAARLTGHVLLHRYCDVAPVLARFEEERRPRDLAGLHRAMWDFA